MLTSGKAYDIIRESAYHPEEPYVTIPSGYLVLIPKHWEEYRVDVLPPWKRLVTVFYDI